METIRIPNAATYSPLPLADLAMTSPLAARLLLGATPPGRALQGIAMAFYAASAVQDWIGRLGVRPIEFLEEYGADVWQLTPMPDAARETEMRVLAERLNDCYTPDRPTLDELAPLVDQHLTAYIASITDQRVETSTEVRRFSLTQLVFPFALGAADPISGDVAIFRDTGVFQPHVVAHEFCHRKGYLKELHAQALAYLTLASSGEPVLVQAALSERLHRDLRAISGDDGADFERRVKALELRSEIEPEFLALKPVITPVMQPFADAMRRIYDLRMKLTGQNGISDYDVGFTNFLYTFETRVAGRQRPVAAAAVHASATP